VIRAQAACHDAMMQAEIDDPPAMSERFLSGDAQ
jgi:hypothetical protein